LSEGSRMMLVAEGIGVTFVMKSAANYLPDSAVLRPVDDLTIDLPLELVWRRDNSSRALMQFAAETKKLAMAQPALRGDC
jgi:DNA-binding transcriptional LysR family regulator